MFLQTIAPNVQRTKKKSFVIQFSLKENTNLGTESGNEELVYWTTESLSFEHILEPPGLTSATLGYLGWRSSSNNRAQ